MAKPVCKFWKQGKCNKGAYCNFAHSDPKGNNDSTNSGEASRVYNLNDFISPKAVDRKAKEVKQDMDEYGTITSRPALSSYGLAHPAVNNLIAGRDLSFEEMRLRYIEAQANNTVPQFEKEMNLRAQDMNYCVNQIKNRESVAVRYQQKSAENPSIIPKPFIMTLEESTKNLENGGGAGGSAFGNLGFGNNNNNSNVGSAFGGSSFSNQNQGSAFGAPSGGQSAFGGSGFGASSFGSGAGSGAFGSQTKGAFGSATGAGGSTNNSGSAFGTGNAFGTGSPFGSGATGGSSFGSSGFGAKNATASGFGSSGFGTAALGTATNNTSTTGSAFGNSGFGAQSGAGAFGSSGFGSSGFGAKAPTSAFGNQAATTGNSSGTGLVFGAAKSGSSSFGSLGFGASNLLPFGTAPTSTNSSTPLPFASSGTSNPFGSTSTSSNPFGNPPAASTNAALAFGATTSAFGGGAPANQLPFGASNANSGTLPFGTSNGTSTALPFGNTLTSQPFGQNSTTSSSTDYSPNNPDLTELGPDVIEAFKAISFTLGKVPDTPPPKSICT